jgi:hypothetical protein
MFVGYDDIPNWLYLYTSTVVMFRGIAMAVFGLPVAWIPTLLGIIGTVIRIIDIIDVL